MKSRIIYILVFLAAFILTSAAIVYLNGKYVNIFAFDFRPEGVQSVTPADTAAAPKTIAENLQGNTPVKNDSTMKPPEESLTNLSEEKLTDSLYSAALNKLTDTVKTINPETNKLRNTSLTEKKAEIKDKPEINITHTVKPDTVLKQNAETTPEPVNIAGIKTDLLGAEDSLYNSWKKSTAKLYENMDPKKAAKIISSYSDNMARDIIYTMKKKKAAEILAELNPEFASRITRMR